MIDLFSLMSAGQLLAAAAALPLAWAFLCRLSGGVTWRTVQPRFVGMHLCGLFYCGTVLFLQPDGVELIGEFLGLGFCACWLWVSYPTWKNGPPEHVQTRPAPLEVMEGRR